MNIVNLVKRCSEVDLSPASNVTISETYNHCKAVKAMATKWQVAFKISRSFLGLWSPKLRYMTSYLCWVNPEYLHKFELLREKGHTRTHQPIASVVAVRGFIGWTPMQVPCLEWKNPGRHRLGTNRIGPLEQDFDFETSIELNYTWKRRNAVCWWSIYAQAKSFMEPTAINTTNQDGKGYLTQWRPMSVAFDIVDMWTPWIK